MMRLESKIHLCAFTIPIPSDSGARTLRHMLLEMNRPAQAREQFADSLKRTPGRPRAIFGLARSAQLLGDNQMAAAKCTDFLQVWKNADQNLPEIAAAKKFQASTQTG